MDGHKLSDKTEKIGFLHRSSIKITLEQCEKKNLVENIPRGMKAVIKCQGYSEIRNIVKIEYDLDSHSLL